MPTGVDPFHVTDCGPGCIEPEASDVTDCAPRRRSSCTSTGTASVNPNVAESSVPSAFGEMTGVDTHRHSNHDMVKESATIFWYAALD